MAARLGSTHAVSVGAMLSNSTFTGRSRRDHVPYPPWRQLYFLARMPPELSKDIHVHLC